MNTSEWNHGPLAYSADELAGFLGVSLRHIRRLDADGLLPKPIRLGRSVRWPAVLVEQWLADGAPGRDVFQAVHAGGEKGGEQ